MKNLFRKQSVYFRLALVVLLLGGSVWMLRHEIEQEQLNHRFAIAFLANDAHRALMMLNQGANPDTPLPPQPHSSLWHVMLRLFRLERNQMRSQDTALLLVLAPLPQTGYRNLSDKILLVQALVAHGANVNVKTHTGNTPLLLAAWTDDSVSADLLVKHGADVNARMLWDGNRTALMYAASNGNADMAVVLLNHGADVNARDFGGNTPLILAGISTSDMHAYEKVVRVLLAYHSDVNVRNTEGMTPLSQALASGQRRIVAMLRKNIREADVYRTNGPNKDR